MTKLELSIVEEYFNISTVRQDAYKCPYCEADTGKGFTHFNDCRALAAYKRISDLLDEARAANKVKDG